MPLQLLLVAKWEKTISWHDKPPLVTLLRVFAVLAWMLTAFFSNWQLCRERFAACRSKEKRITAGWSIRLVRQIVFIPLLLGTIATLSMFLPGQAFGLEFAIAVGTVLQVSAVMFHCLEVFGQPPYTQAVVANLPRRRWWCGGKCGGFADALPWLSYIYGQAKEAQKITVGQLSTAYYMVGTWMLVNLVSASYTLYFLVWPKEMVEIDGWCYSHPAMRKSTNIVMTVIVVWSSLFGMSGFGVISGASALAMTGSKAVHAEKIMRRSSLAQLYVSIPLIKAILGILPVHFRTPTLEHFSPMPLNTTQRISHMDWMNTSLVVVNTRTVGKVLECPAFDAEVMNLLMYACAVSLLMAYLSYRNWKLNPISDWKQDLRVNPNAMSMSEIEPEPVRAGSEDEGSEAVEESSSSSDV